MNFNCSNALREVHEMGNAEWIVSLRRPFLFFC
jgi:hypothetical protein